MSDLPVSEREAWCGGEMAECPVCHGHGRLPGEHGSCGPTCDRGHFERGAKCPRCGGTGKVPHPPPDEATLRDVNYRRGWSDGYDAALLNIDLHVYPGGAEDAAADKAASAPEEADLREPPRLSSVEAERGLPKGERVIDGQISDAPAVPSVEEVERAAKAIYEVKRAALGLSPWDALDDLTRHPDRELARAALAAARQSGGDDGKD